MKTLYDKIWDAHLVLPETDAPAILYIDLHLIHEVTTPQAFAELRRRGLRVRRPDRTFATMDHSIPTTSRSLAGFDEMAAKQVRQLAANCKDFGVPLFDLESPRQGIVHVIGPELGLTQPGLTIVCGDSPTSTHGAFGALAHGIGTTEVGMALATQCLLARKSKNFAVHFDGQLQRGPVRVRGFSAVAGLPDQIARRQARRATVRLKQNDLEGGTFTISNLGMYGVEQFVAVLNPPQASILAVGATEDRPVVQEGNIVVRPMMTMTLTVDHRAVDGAQAADFLRTLKTFLEDPALAL